MPLAVHVEDAVVLLEQLELKLGLFGQRFGTRMLRPKNQIGIYANVRLFFSLHVLSRVFL